MKVYTFTQKWQSLLPSFSFLTSNNPICINSVKPLVKKRCLEMFRGIERHCLEMYRGVYLSVGV